MTDKMADVAGRRRPGSPTSESEIVGQQFDIGRRHFSVQFSDT